MLDPIMRNILQYLAKRPGPKIWEQPVATARSNFAEYLTFFGPQNIALASIEDTNIAGPAGALRLRIYRPNIVEGPLPVLIYFHGGGFVMGSVETHDGLCRFFSSETCLPVISIDYRLAPENKWPAALEDCMAAVEWIVKNDTSLKIDRNKILLIGDSSGGQLVASIARWAKLSGGPRVIGQIFMFPGIDFTTTSGSMTKYGEGYFLEKKTIEWFHGLTLNGGEAPLPLAEQDPRGLPSAYFMLSSCDPMYDEGLRHAERLRNAGVTVQIATYHDLVHCFIYLYAALPQAKIALTAACTFIKEITDSPS
jgi:acetyl esterase